MEAQGRASRSEYTSCLSVRSSLGDSEPGPLLHTALCGRACRRVLSHPDDKIRDTGQSPRSVLGRGGVGWGGGDRNESLFHTEM